MLQFTENRQRNIGLSVSSNPRTVLSSVGLQEASGAEFAAATAANRYLSPRLFTDWAAYTPTVSSQGGTITTATATGRYQQLGKTVHVQIEITITTAGSGSGSVRATLPVSAESNSYSGSSICPTTGKSGFAVILTSVGVGIVGASDATGTTYIASSRTVVIGITYEAA